MMVSVIIVNYNTHEHIRKCLISVQDNFKSIPYEVIVVDNNSPDRGIESLQSEFPLFRFIFRDVNDGFGAGCNYGAKNSVNDAEYLFFVNPDIIFIDDAAYKFCLFMAGKTDIAVCSGLLTDNDGNLLYSYNYNMSVKWEIMSSLKIGLKNYTEKLLNRKEIRENKPFEIDWALGALLFCRKALFNQVRGFDDDFFLYTEDNDLQLRLKNKGYKVMCLPYARAQHFYGSSMEDENSKKMFNLFFYQSKMVYLYKHFNFFKRNVIRSIIMLGLLLRVMKTFFSGKNNCKTSIKEFKPVVKAVVSSYKTGSH